jgi:hypothetical protein
VNGGVVIAAAKDLGERFRLVDLLPTAVLGLFVLGIVWSGAPRQSPDLGKVAARAEQLSGWAGLLLAVTLMAAALILEPLQITLVRVLEGYWGESLPGRLLAAPGKAFHRSRRRRLDRLQQRRGDNRTGAARREEAARRLGAYPRAAAVLPTKLGNVLRAAEHRAGSRYGLDAITLWPRLYPVLADRTRAVLDDLRNQLDLAARFCSIFLAATVIAIACLARHGWWLTVAAGTLLLAGISYRAALTAAAAYGQAIEAAVDLHRFDLLHALHLPLPANLTSEIQANEHLTQFLRQPHEYVYALTTRGRGLDFSYDHGQPVNAREASSRTGLLARLRVRRLPPSP